MKSLRELDPVIAQGEEAFQIYIEQALYADNNLFQRRFSLKNGEKSTILNFLIRKHNSTRHQNMSGYIRWLLKNGANVNTDQPLHLLIRLKKMDLYPIFMNKNYLPQPGNWQAPNSDVQEQHLVLHCRDNEGRTLLSRAIAAGQGCYVNELIELGADIDESSKMKVAEAYIDLQPLHQAVLCNFTEATQALILAGAPVENPCGPLSETPILLAAKHGKIESLATLFFCSAEHLQIDNENTEGMRPIDLLCRRLQEEPESQEILRGIAMLLCHGAEAPRNEEFCSLLEDKRLALLDEVKKYTQASHCSATKFVRACHDKNNRLHNIIYATESWIEPLKRTFGFSSHEVFLVESLVFEVSNSLNQRGSQRLEVSREEELREQSAPSFEWQNQREEFSRDERQFAEFVWRYRQSFSGFFKNPFSTMHWKLTSGECTSIKQVRDYANQHHQELDEKKIRTELLLNAMKGEKLVVHDDLVNEESISFSGN